MLRLAKFEVDDLMPLLIVHLFYFRACSLLLFCLLGGARFTESIIALFPHLPSSKVVSFSTELDSSLPPSGQQRRAAKQNGSFEPKARD